jgi:hypothetical protein
VFWKRVRQAKWMEKLLLTPDRLVRERTAAAFAPRLSDAQRLAELGPLPGFGGGGAIASLLLCAWDPIEYGVYDRLVVSAKQRLIVPACTCNWSALPTYFEHLRKIRDELSTGGAHWTARMVDMAMVV